MRRLLASAWAWTGAATCGLAIAPGPSAHETGSQFPPMHTLTAPTRMMKDLGYGRGYAYDHDTADGFSGQNYFPDGLARQRFYNPAERGFEREIQKRLAYWDKLRSRHGGGESGESGDSGEGGQ